MAKKNQAVLNKILKNNKDFEKVIPLVLDEGVTLKRSVSIGKNKINELIKELVLTVKFVKENDLDYMKNNMQILEYFDFLIVKYFTDLEEALTEQDYYVHIDTYNQLYDKGYLDKALLEIGEKGIAKVRSAFDNFTVNLLNLNKETDEILKELADQNGEAI